MAILKGINTKMKGSVGDWTYVRKSGRTIASEKATEVAQPRTPAQMARRVCWRNIQNMWAAHKGQNHPSFEVKARYWSDANAFMSANIDGPRVYLTKSEAAQMGCVVAAYRVTYGSLPSIDVLQSAGQFVSNIGVGETALSGLTTVGTLADAIVEANPGFSYGDQLSAFVYEQSVDSLTGVPHVAVRAYEITLISEDERTLNTVLGGNLEAFTVTGGKIGMQGPINGGVVWIHSRIENGKTRVSTQYVNVTNNILSAYTSASKRSAAIASYGGRSAAAFLTPNIEEDISQG